MFYSQTCNIVTLFNDYILFQKYTPFKFVCLLYIGQSSFTFLPHVSSKFALPTDQFLALCSGNTSLQEYYVVFTDDAEDHIAQDDIDGVEVQWL